MQVVWSVFKLQFLTFKKSYLLVLIEQIEFPSNPLCQFMLAITSFRTLHSLYVCMSRLRTAPLLGRLVHVSRESRSVPKLITNKFIQNAFQAAVTAIASTVVPAGAGRSMPQGFQAGVMMI